MKMYFRTSPSWIFFICMSLSDSLPKKVVKTLYTYLFFFLMSCATAIAMV